MMAEKTVGGNLLKNLQGFFKGPTTAETKVRPMPSIKEVQEAVGSRDTGALDRIMEVSFLLPCEAVHHIAEGRIFRLSGAGV
jgi:hypothetical protein